MQRLALLVPFALIACGGPQPAVQPVPEPKVEEPPVIVGPAVEVATEETTEAPPPASTESAFDSNQWNSAVGLGGGGGAYGGRTGGRGAPAAESYASVETNGYLAAIQHGYSTFAADVDTASFTNVRRFLADGELPPSDAVRVEEFVNACSYDVASPDTREVFGISSEIAACPWNKQHELVRLTVNTKAIETERVPPCNLVFLIDISGSMNRPHKLPLLQQSLDLLIRQLRPQDHVAIVTYASGVRVPLASARGDEQDKIRAAVQALKSSGGTNGEGGIQAAYDLAKKHQVAGVNRVLLATDGDFNIGIRRPDALEAFITERKNEGTFLSVLGFGGGNLKDDRLERLANTGNGVYTYIDSIHTARRVLVEQFGASMMTVAKDVKLQTEWNTEHVKQYRLLGYENRLMSSRDFRDDNKDGGEIGAGHVVTALYEIERNTDGSPTDDTFCTLRIRYKPPMGDDARELARPLAMPKAIPAKLSANGQVAATAAALAMQLRGDEDVGELDFNLVADMATHIDPERHAELVRMVRMAREIDHNRAAEATASK